MKSTESLKCMYLRCVSDLLCSYPAFGGAGKHNSIKCDPWGSWSQREIRCLQLSWWELSYTSCYFNSSQEVCLMPVLSFRVQDTVQLLIFARTLGTNTGKNNPPHFNCLFPLNSMWQPLLSSPAELPSYLVMIGSEAGGLKWEEFRSLKKM